MSDTLKIGGMEAKEALSELFDAIPKGKRFGHMRAMQVIETAVHLARLGMPLLKRGRALVGRLKIAHEEGAEADWLKDVDNLLPPA